MSRPRKAALQRCLLYGNVPRGVEDAAPYKCKCRFFDKLESPTCVGDFYILSHPILDHHCKSISS